MMKSRGLRPANCARIALQNPLRAPRQFSTHASFKAPVLLRTRNPSLGLRSALNAPALRTPFVAGSAVPAIRFASTSPAAATPSVLENSKATAADAVSSASSASTEAVPSSVDVVTDEFLANLANMPEQIGYLKAVGLDYGWGPTSCIEWLLEHVHIWMDLPWWSSIIVTAVIVRTSLFPLFARTSDVTARQQALKVVTDPLNAKMNEARIAGNTDQMMMARAELMGVYKQAGINPWKAFYAPVAQGVTGYCTWKLLRAMAALPVPGLESGGFLWLSDLTVSDPLYILPLCFGALIHTVAKSGGESGTLKQFTGLQKKFMFYIMPGLAVLFTFAQPATVQLSFFAASTLGMLQARILRNQTVREWIGLAPILETPMAKTNRSSIIDVEARATKPGDFQWQPPTVQSSIADAGPIKQGPVSSSPLGKIKRSYEQTKKELRDFKDGIMKRAGMYQANTKSKRESKQFLDQASSYEKRRQTEQEFEAGGNKRRRRRR
ncbi:mitochondrial export translocase oxa1 [Diplodia corticola]|uniref:Mitochondrial export translocase oxa1 n=1 Tax=Diplodia corticola TaxID=236234 RepID=A0A1J9QXC4_9PEZI|nr:mitochondrial export translocase oxa1 [Diplodia corticola]OJD33033.1 mitochondrial export translocase oxa1 [Diplodia corticola]